MFGFLLSLDCIGFDFVCKERYNELFCCALFLQLIQKRAIQLMSQLSSSSGNWNLNAKMCGDVKDKLMELSGDANGNLKEMLNNISSKIDADQMKQ